MQRRLCHVETGLGFLLYVAALGTDTGLAAQQRLQKVLLRWSQLLDHADIVLVLCATHNTEQRMAAFVKPSVGFMVTPSVRICHYS